MLEGRSLENVWHLYHTKPWPSCSRPIPSRQQNPKRDNHEILIGFIISWSIPPELHGFLKKFQDVSKWWSFKKNPGSKPPFFPQHHHVVVGIFRFFGVESPPWRQPCRGKMQKCNNFPKKSGLVSAQHLHLRHSICLLRHKKSTKKAKGACWHGKKNGFFSRWRAQNCPKMVDYVLFSASFHPFLVAGCFLGGYFLDVAPPTSNSPTNNSTGDVVESALPWRQPDQVKGWRGSSSCALCKMNLLSLKWKGDSISIDFNLFEEC